MVPVYIHLLYLVTILVLITMYVHCNKVLQQVIDKGREQRGHIKTYRYLCYQLTNKYRTSTGIVAIPWKEFKQYNLEQINCDLLVGNRIPYTNNRSPYTKIRRNSNTIEASSASRNDLILESVVSSSLDSSSSGGID